MDWLGQTEYIMSCNEEYRSKASEILQIYRDKGIQPVVLKGESCAQYYPNPNRRALGDLDVFLMEDSDTPHMGGHEWAYEEGNRLARILGAEVDLHDYKHSHITWRGLTIENHRLLTTARGSNVKKEFEKHLQTIIPSADFEALFLTVHAFQHFMTEGLSIRQICDWGLFLKCHQNDVEWKDFFLWMKRLGMYRFSITMNSIAEQNLAIELNDSKIERDSAYSNYIINDAFNREGMLDAKALGIVKFRWEQLKRMCGQSWKYRYFMNENLFTAYTKMIWRHWFDEI